MTYFLDNWPSFLTASFQHFHIIHIFLIFLKILYKYFILYFIIKKLKSKLRTTIFIAWSEMFDHDVTCSLKRLWFEWFFSFFSKYLTCWSTRRVREKLFKVWQGCNLDKKYNSIPWPMTYTFILLVRISHYLIKKKSKLLFFFLIF